MTIDKQESPYLREAKRLAETGLYKNAAEVEDALTLSEAGVWNKSLSDPEVLRELDQRCANAKARPNQSTAAK